LTHEDRPAISPARRPSRKIYLSHRDFTAPHASNVAGAGLPRGVAAAKHFAIACSRAAVSSVALSQADPATATHWFWKTPTTAHRDFALSPLALRHASSAPSRAARSVGLPATMADETSALSGVALIAIATQASERVGRPATNTAAHRTLSRFLLIMSSTVRLWRAPKAIPFATKSGPSPGLKIILFGHAAYVVPRARCSRYALSPRSGAMARRCQGTTTCFPGHARNSQSSAHCKHSSASRDDFLIMWVAISE